MCRSPDGLAFRKRTRGVAQKRPNAQNSAATIDMEEWQSTIAKAAARERMVNEVSRA